MNNNWYYWEEEQAAAGQAPATTPQTPGGIGAPGQESGVQQNPQQPPQSNAKTEDPNAPKDDITQDPQHPNMGDDEQDDQDFEEFRSEYMEMAIKGDTEEMLQALKKMLKKDLDATQNKFVRDNILIMWLREDSNIDKASKEIRKAIKDSLDDNYPATSLMQHITMALEKLPALNNIFFKLLGTGQGKGDYHRKFIASLLCAIQTGSGASREDIVYSEKDYSIDISTRFASEWGEINLGKWSSRTDDPQRYLEEPEIARLKDGSPEEKTVLRHRLVLASIAEQFKRRAFLIHVANPDGTINAMGWDVGDSMNAGYVDGKLVVRSKTGDSNDAFIDAEGNIVAIPDLLIKFVKDTGRVDDRGVPMTREYPFMEKIGGILYFTANINTIRMMSGSLSGVFFKEIPYNGNPSDISQLISAVPSLNDILLRKQ